MPYVNNQGVRIHYQVEGDGPPLVLQHGFMGSVKQWHTSGYVNALQSRYQLILVDARGHGSSDKPHESAAYGDHLHVGDVVAVLNALNLRAVPFWGYSMGGWIGFNMAKYAPERVQAFILGGAHPYGRRLPVNRPDGSDPQAFLGDLFGPKWIEWLATLPAENEFKAQTLANDFRALAAATHDRPSLEDILPTMTIPCLLYAGELDGGFPKFQACVKQMPNATFVSLPGCNHIEGFSRADLVLPHVTQFLDGLR